VLDLKRKNKMSRIQIAKFLDQINQKIGGIRSVVNRVLQGVKNVDRQTFDAAQALKKSPLKSTRKWPRLGAQTTAIVVSHLCDCGSSQ
jgi:hypothetical protein